MIDKTNFLNDLANWVFCYFEEKGAEVEKDLYSTEEVEKMSGRKKKTICDWCKQRGVGHVKYGGKVFLTREAVKELKERNWQPPEVTDPDKLPPSLRDRRKGNRES